MLVSTVLMPLNKLPLITPVVIGSKKLIYCSV